MAKTPRNTLKGVFEDNDIPSGSDFVNLIDSSMDLSASGETAIQSTASFQAGSPILLTQTGSVIKIDATTIRIMASGEAGLTTVACLQAASTITLTQTGSVIKLDALGSFSIMASGQPALTTTACLQAASTIIITQTGSIIKLDPTGGGGTGLTHGEVISRISLGL